MNPGELKNKIIVLSYVLENGVYKFISTFTTGAKIEREYKRKNFSKFGYGADESAKIITRYIPNIDCSNAIKIGNKHYLLTSIERLEEQQRYLELNAVQQPIVMCVSKRNIDDVDHVFNRPINSSETVFTFEAYLVEKYVGYTEEKVNSISSKIYILITPKIIKLIEGDLIYIDSIEYNLQKTHTLGNDFNEYEIEISKDV